MTRTARALLLLTALSPVALQACGGSSAKASTAYCTAWKKINRADTGAHGDDPAAITDPKVMKATWTDSLALADTLLANAPADIADDLGTVVDNLKAQGKVMADNGYDITSMAKDPEVRSRMDALTGDAEVSKAKSNYVSYSDDACGTSYATS